MGVAYCYATCVASVSPRGRFPAIFGTAMSGEFHLEDFWGVELSSANKKYVWKEDEDDEDDFGGGNRTLELRQACLGAKAKDGQRNVVELTTENEEGDSVTHTILSLGVGKLEQSQLLLTLRAPVSLELVTGSGPVHIVGSVQDTFDAFDSDDEDSDSESEEEEITESSVAKLGAVQSKKRPAIEQLISAKPNKMQKISAQDQDGDSDEDSDDEMEEGSEDDEDSDEDDYEEESDEEEEEEDEPPPPPKKMSNGKKAGKSTAPQFKTPQAKKTQAKVQTAKGSRSAPTTPKDKGSPAAKVLTTEEIKLKLTKQHPNLPKKMEKFNNFIANSFKVKDDSAKKELWKFAQQLGKAREQ